MTTTTVTLTTATLVSSASNAAGATTRGTRSMIGKHGALLTAKITNGGTGPTIQCTATVLIAHTTGSTPTAASEGADWKTYAVLGGGGTTANAVTPMSIVLPPCCHVEIEFTGNTGQAVTVESLITDYTNLDTV
jgi:hypothetical protein